MNEFEKQQAFAKWEELLRKPSKVTESREFPSWEVVAKRNIQFEYIPKESSASNVLSFFRKPIGITLVGGSALSIAAALFFVFLLKPSKQTEVANASVAKTSKTIVSPLKVIVSSVKGKVSVLPEGSSHPVALVKNYQLVSGDVIITEGNSQSDLDFETGSWMRITPNSEVILDRIEKTEDSQFQKFSVKKGKLFASVSKLSKDSQFVVQAGEHLTQVRGTVFSVQFDGKTEVVAVREGSVSVGDLILNSQQQTIAKLGENPVIAASLSAKEDKELKAFQTQSVLARESKLYEEHARLELVRLEDGTEYRGVILGQSETHLHFQGLEGLIEIPIQKILETEKIR
ncbi:FecR domain-containing protein [Leptospira sp. 2 VSF19]|uniref:FecR domain-containing protein n=1 Tax=Leptospira soteropolitanensis TaxID=2950025 RepID=A0AAW5VG19_9LEPT|nr:FecR family protein [Leptospira soteropolitanensis]MCW7492579.1 FecR domain-containing protein [Leptospira soteropolitanensis]MCW7500262.1 FecR domain-containing protein [Leptospira soteropolitanensis]MCW7522703.1 FecR domain-containing protein [Leptospira soteropolitanensis]MCW7526559.1 FecR domain-containing protein [Leptospira soteropolitanensis]MCW7530232.1 FecR domain-containing protein [Leptospira soteropolitanensis]